MNDDETTEAPASPGPGINKTTDTGTVARVEEPAVIESTGAKEGS